MKISGLPMRFVPVLAVVMLSLWGGGCVRSTNPILKDEQVITDDSLAGRWVSKDGKETVDVNAPDKAKKTYQVVYTDKDGKKGPFVMRLGTVGKLTLVEIQPQEPAPEASDAYKSHLLPLYSFLVIRQTTPQVVFTAMSDKWLKEYLTAHPSELQIIGPSKDSPIVTSPTEDFQAFLIRHSDDDGIFGEPSTLVRPGDPTTQATTQAATPPTP